SGVDTSTRRSGRYSHEEAKRFAELIAHLVYRELPGSTSIVRKPVAATAATGTAAGGVRALAVLVEHRASCRGARRGVAAGTDNEAGRVSQRAGVRCVTSDRFCDRDQSTRPHGSARPRTPVPRRDLSLRSRLATWERTTKEPRAAAR